MTCTCIRVAALAHATMATLRQDMHISQGWRERKGTCALHWQWLHAGELHAVHKYSMFWRDAHSGKRLASMVGEVRLASTSLRRIRRPRSPEAAPLGASLTAASFILSALLHFQRHPSVHLEDQKTGSQACDLKAQEFSYHGRHSSNPAGHSKTAQ